MGKPTSVVIDVEEYINYITTNAIPKAMTAAEIKEATQERPDPPSCHRPNNYWSLVPVPQKSQQVGVSHDMLRALHGGKNELSVNIKDNILLQGCHIVIPEALQNKAVSLAHVGHQGIVKTKALLRQKVWFPGIDQKVETLIQQSIACQATEHPRRNKEPLSMTELPQGPWEELSADFCGSLQGAQEEYLLVIIDNYSRYPVIESVKSMAASTVLAVGDKIFAMFGTPKVFCTDNSSPFNSTKFADIAKHLGFQHRKITPYWPQANGEAERMMKNLNKVL